jgi:hypothetical protein
VAVDAAGHQLVPQEEQQQKLKEINLGKSAPPSGSKGNRKTCCGNQLKFGFYTVMAQKQLEI